MDKYQKNLLFCGYFDEQHSQVRDITKNFVCISKKNNVIVPSELDIKKDIFTINQEEDIFSTEYYFVILPIKTVSKVFYYQGKQEIEVLLDSFPFNPQKQGFCIPVDFNKRVSKIKICFENNLADDYFIKLKYIEADKDVYYSKQEENRKADLLKKLDLSHATGADLVNIYFQPCSENYAKTEIFLYRNGKIIAKYTVDEEMYFKSITGLAYGEYSYKIKQYDKDGKLLIETQESKFYIQEREQDTVVYI